VFWQVAAPTNGSCSCSDFTSARAPVLDDSDREVTSRRVTGGLERVMVETLVENGRRIKRTTTVFTPATSGTTSTRKVQDCDLGTATSQAKGKGAEAEAEAEHMFQVHPTPHS